jgi:hypothetical protein
MLKGKLIPASTPSEQGEPQAPADSTITRIRSRDEFVSPTLMSFRLSALTPSDQPEEARRGGGHRCVPDIRPSPKLREAEPYRAKLVIRRGPVPISPRGNMAQVARLGQSMRDLYMMGKPKLL